MKNPGRVGNLRPDRCLHLIPYDLVFPAGHAGKEHDENAFGLEELELFHIKMEEACA